MYVAIVVLSLYARLLLLCVRVLLAVPWLPALCYEHASGQGHTDPGKSWNLKFKFLRPGKSWTINQNPCRISDL